MEKHEQLTELCNRLVENAPQLDDLAELVKYNKLDKEFIENSLEPHLTHIISGYSEVSTEVVYRVCKLVVESLERKRMEQYGIR